MAYFVAGLLVLLGLFLMSRWFIATDPAKLAKYMKWAALAAITGFALWFLLRGRLDLLSYAAFVALPFFLRWRGLFQRLRTMAKNAGGPSDGQSSQVRTDYLDMRLDHDSGELNGAILKGSFAGRYLDELALEECLSFLSESADDQQTGQVLEAYLDRRFGMAWRESAHENSAGGGGGQTSDGTMTRRRALEVLGLEEGAGAEEIIAAHRRLMKTAHPDHGGSDFLAQQINHAKDVLLNG